MKRTLAATLLLLAGALPAAAQTSYAAPGDTLRFREVTQGRITVTTPQGEIPITMENRAIVAVVRMRGDSARGWYDSLSIMAATPGGEMRPAADSALHRHFRLAFDSRGHVRLVQAPTFPASFEGLTDLSHQFDDFFLRLPAQSLRIGLAWSDTASRADSATDKFTRWTTNADYRVERDTTVGGTPALVVSMRQKLHIHGEGPVPKQPMRAVTTMEGTDDGFFVFAPREGRVLGRRRSGKLEGDTNMTGAGGTMTVKQTYAYTGTLDAVR
jgi:hypothetical protein